MVYSISDLAIEAGLSYHTVYFYIKEGLLTETTRIGNRQRIFDDNSLDVLKRIVELRKEGESIERIRAIIQQEAADAQTEHL